MADDSILRAIYLPQICYMIRRNDQVFGTTEHEFCPLCHKKEKKMYEEIAEAIRKAYGEAEKDTNPRMLYHIQEQPWETLPDHRKYKWIEMAKAAAQIYRNHGLGIDF